jgi:rhodanese-related sulfurtransferase
MSSAVRFFTERLQFQTDVADVHTALETGTPGFTLIDTRGIAGWQQGHIPGAVHLPTADIPGLVPPATPVVTYCWGPGCNGATKAALAFAQRGYEVKEMLGGIEYWIREGFPVETDTGTVRRPSDPLTSPAGAITCDC